MELDTESESETSLVINSDIETTLHENHTRAL